MMHLVMTTLQLTALLYDLGEDIRKHSNCEDPWAGVNPKEWLREYLAHHVELVGERAPIT